MESSKLSLWGLESGWLVLQRRWFPGAAVFLSVLSLGIIATHFKKPIYSATGQLQYKNINPASSVIDPQANSRKIDNSNLKNNPIDTESEIIRSKPVIQETLEQLNWRNEQGEPLKPKELLGNLSVSNILGTDLLSISYQSKDPEKSAEAVNTLMSVFLEKHLSSNRAELVATRKFIEKQLPEAKETVAQAELAVRQFQEENQIVALDSEAAEIMTQFNKLEQQINDIESEIANISSQSQEIQRKLGVKPEKAFFISTLSQSPAIEQLNGQIQQLESQLVQEKGRFTDANPQIIELKNKLASLKKMREQKISQLVGNRGKIILDRYSGGQLQEELTRDLVRLETTNQGLKAKAAQLSRVQAQYKQKINALPQLEQQLQALRRELQISQSTYSLLLQKLQEVRIAENQNIGNFRVVAQAIIPDEPIPYRSLNYLASGLLASLAAAATIYVLEATDKSIKTVDEAKSLFGYTWLGIIPAVEESNLARLAGHSDIPLLPQQIVRDHPSSSVSESYRMLQSNLRFLSSDQNIKTIIVTSSVAGEGKSTISANLAAAMAQAGNRVLLIDGDLHYPSQHHIWELDNELGLSNIIAEQLDPRLAIEEVSLNLDVLSAGIVPPNPATLLDSQRMEALLDYLSRRYDLVIIDTPSLDFTADAPIIGRMADGVLLVVKPGQVEQNKARFAKEILAQSGQNVLGIVINGVSPKAEPNIYYYHAIEGKHNSDEPLRILEQPEEELWETVSRLARESKKTQINLQMDLTDLNTVPVEKLSTIISYMEKDLASLTRLVREQEDELTLQEQKVKRLQRKINLAMGTDQFRLEQELNQEEEIKEMLDETLIGQRRNLNKKNQILRQYRHFLEIRQNKLSN